MVTELYAFPVLKPENIVVIEAAYCELLNTRRRDEPLPVEALDWMDAANNFLITSGEK